MLKGIAISIFLLLIVLLHGCHVGPKFVPPPPPQTSSYTKASFVPDLVPGNGEPAQQLISGENLPKAWWGLFQSDSLNQVVAMAIENNPTIEEANANLAQAHQYVLAAKSAYYPGINFNSFVDRVKLPALPVGLLPGISAPPFNLFALGSVLSYSPDVFGLISNTVEQEKAFEEFQAFQLAIAHLTISGNVVNYALTIAQARAQLHAFENIIDDDLQRIAIIEKQLTNGTVNLNELLSAQNQLENDRAYLPHLKQQISSSENALAILVGRAPSDWSPPEFNLEEFHLPEDLPLIEPAQLVQRRPDILAAQAYLHASCAAIGIATASFFPQLDLSGRVFPIGETVSHAFRHSNLFWSLFFGISSPTYQGGRLWAQRQQKIDAYRAALANYDQTVLESLRQVADAIQSLNYDTELLKAEKKSVDILDKSLLLQQQRLSVGVINRIQLLDMMRQKEQTQFNYVTAKAQRYFDTAQLFIVLGGGLTFENISDTKCPTEEHEV